MAKRIIIILILILIIGGALGGYTYLKSIDNAMNPSDGEIKVIDIPMGSSTTDIANLLESEGIIDDAFKFRLFSRINEFDGLYQAGSYTLSPAMTPREICELISSGEVTVKELVVPEGYNIEDIGNALASLGFSKEIFLKEITRGDFSEYDFLPNNKSLEKPLEGYLVPATYKLSSSNTELDIIKMMLDEFEAYIEPVDYEAKAKKLNLDLNQVLTIASIIEKETYLPEDRPIVASVIYNRLKENMKLQMDSTVNYALNQSELNVTYDDMEVDSPYNTYVIDGLPPGPICSPSIGSIEAALNPASTKYLYFVLSDKGDGSNVFSETYEEFEKNRESYYASLDG